MTTVCGLTISFEIMSIGRSTDERDLVVNVWSFRNVSKARAQGKGIK